MAITSIPGGGMTITGGHTELMKWAYIKQGIILESNSSGMKLTRGPTMRHRFAAELGLTPRTSHAKFLEVIEAKMAAVNTVANAQDDAAKALREGKVV